MIGGPGVTVEADETYLSKSPKTRKPEGTALNAKPARRFYPWSSATARFAACT
jgi:hypothetical protein